MLFDLFEDGLVFGGKFHFHVLFALSLYWAFVYNHYQHANVFLVAYVIVE